jgi:hypothetical protein
MRIQHLTLDEGGDGLAALTVLMTADEAATIVEKFGQLSRATGATDATEAIHACLSAQFNRFYEDGVTDFRRGAKPIS